MSADPDDARAQPPTDPILRNTLRYTVSAREYAALHKYVLSRSKTLRRATPTPGTVDKALRPATPGGDFNARTVRHALRVFAATWVGMKGWEVLARRVGKKE